MSVELARYPAGRVALLGAAGIVGLSAVSSSQQDVRAVGFMIALGLVLIVSPFAARAALQKRRDRAKRRARLRDLAVLLGLGLLTTLTVVFLALRRKSKEAELPAPDAAEIDALVAQLDEGAR